MLRRLLLLTVFLASPALAEDPPLPQPLAAQKAHGAQVYYLGKFDTLDGWTMIRSGQPEFYYSTPGGKAIVMGLLFDGNGDLKTTEQMKALDLTKEGGIVDMMASQIQDPTKALPLPNTNEAPGGPSRFAAPPVSPAPQTNSTALSQVANQALPNTPANRLFGEVLKTNNLLFGQDGKPVFYAFIDPNCQHCQFFLKAIEPSVLAGDVAVRIIPVAFDDESRRQGAFILSAGDGIDRLLAYAKGDKSALPKPNIDTKAVEANTALLSRWNLMATPIIVYRAGKTGEVKLIRGRPLDMAGALADLRGK
jgi:protein-disulfide isomerase